MLNFQLLPNTLYVCIGLCVCFGPTIAQRFLRKRRQKVYRQALAWVLERGEKSMSARIWVQRTDAGEFLLKYADRAATVPYERILGDSETANDAVLQLEAAGFVVQDGPG